MESTFARAAREFNERQIRELKEQINRLKKVTLPKDFTFTVGKYQAPIVGWMKEEQGMNLIDKDELLKEVKEFREKHEKGETRKEYDRKWWVNATITDIELQIDVMPIIEKRKQGYWTPFINENGQKTYKCSNCGKEVPYDNMNYYNLTSYCPNCGAKMDKEVVE